MTRSVRRWLGGFGAGLLGDQLYFIALAWLASDVVDGAGVAVVLGASGVVRAVLLLGGGVLVDRLGPLRLAVGSDVVRAAVVAGLALMTMLAEPSLPLLVGVSLVFGAVDAVFLPSVGALPALLVPRDDVGRLQGARSLVQRLALVAGAPLAGLVVAGTGIATVFAVAAVLFAVSAILVATVRTLPATDPPDAPGETSGGRRAGTAELAAGLRYVRSRRVVAGTLALIAGAELGYVGPLNVGLPLLVRANGWNASAMGLILGALGLGGIAGAAAMWAFGAPRRAAIAAAVAVALGGPALALVGMAPSVAVAVAGAMLAGACGSWSGALLTTILLTATAKPYLGRVMSLASLASFGGIPVAYAATGIGSDRYGPTVPFVVAGVGIAAVGTSALVLSLRARRVRARTVRRVSC